MQYYQECVALGSRVGLSLVSQTSSAEIEKLYRTLWRKIFIFERQFSRFLPGSELSMFNRNAGTKQSISPEFHGILMSAVEMADITEGLFNPFILPVLQASGYRNSRVPGHEQDTVDDYSNRTLVPINRLEIGSDWARIPYGTAIDLGGCGKGYIADQLSRNLPGSVSGYWLSFGGDIAVGGRDEHEQPWNVSIERASKIERRIGTITASTPVGVATSGVTVHRGKSAGKNWHHIIDPRTGHSAETDVLLATVCHDSPLQADVLASCAVVLGSETGVSFLKSQGARSAVLQCTKGRTKYFGDDIIIDTAHA